MNGTDKRTVEERLSNFGLGFFGYGILAAVITIAAGWPAQFGGPGDPANAVPRDANVRDQTGSPAHGRR